MTECYDNIHHKRFSTLLFLDFKKAFDSVCHKKFPKKLNFYGIRGVANTLIPLYLRNRKLFVCINNEFSTFKSIDLGVPQGSILGPFLFLVYINDLPLSLNSVPILFADDTALCISENSSENLEIFTNQELKNINLWMVSNGLTLHPSKTQALSIAPIIHKSSPSLSLYLCSNIVNSTNTAKYLGILIDDQLSFKSHIHFLEKKLSRSVGIMAKLSYHLPPNALLTLYYSLVHVHLIYAPPVWATTFPTYVIKLKRLQNKAICIITKTSPKDRISPHYCRLQILKLDDLYKFEVAKLMRQFTPPKKTRHILPIFYIFQ